MKAENQGLTEQQVKFLQVIIDNNITQISYQKPEKQLGNIAKDPDTSDILRELEELRILKLMPKGRRSFYLVDLDLAKDVYRAHQ